VAGRIHDEDVAAVRERARIEDVVGSSVNLKRAGGGTLKGLCPFHDEKTPSFTVTPHKGFWHCFGACNEGGDVFDFVMKLNNLSFVEAVEQLADRTGIQLRRIDDGHGGPRQEPGLRMRILEANQLAADFFAEQLATPEALVGRQFLAQRGFDRAAAEHFGVGYAPKAGRTLGGLLKAKGFREDELVKAGLVRASGGYDFFQGRLIWPIRDAGKSTLGFGARRIYDDDRMPAKYLNTPETPVYKKSTVLYGLDLARTNIGKKSQAVVVEGYTDVMAAHLSGVDTAVASCGTAFGDDHARLLQRLMGNHDAFHGEVIFTFDGDQAGQNAALKVFKGDQNFISQTYVAVEPTGLDPCDLRIQSGDAAVRELVGRRKPLYRFVMENVIGQFDLDRADGRLQALRAAAPLMSSIRDQSLVSGYVRELAGMIGMEVDEVRAEVARASRRAPTPEPAQVRPAEPQDEPGALPVLPTPAANDRRLAVERGTLKLLLQSPHLFAPGWNDVVLADFTHPAYRAVFEAVYAAALDEASPLEWTQLVRAKAGESGAEQLVIELAVEPLVREPDVKYVHQYTSRLRLLSVLRDIADLKSKLQRTNPVEHASEHARMFATLLELENRRRALQEESATLID